MARYQYDLADPLLLAAQTGDAARLRTLIAKKRAARKLTQALYQAATFGQSECFQILLDAGGDPMATDRNGNTMLMSSAASGKEDILRALLERGVDVNAANRLGYTPLINAAYDRKLKAVRLLIAAGANVNAQTKDAFALTPLKAAGDKEPIRKALLDAGARLDPGLDQAVGHIRERAAEARSAGREPKFTKADVDAFLLAASHGDLNALRECLAAGMPVDSADDKSHTAVFRAITAGRMPAVEFLRQAGADWQSDPPDLGRLHAAAASGSADMVRMVLASGCDVNARDSNGFTPLIHAAILGRLEAVRALLEAGADPNLRVQSPLLPGNKSTTALEQARSIGDRKVVELLLAAGVPAGPAEFAYEAAKAFRTAAEQPAFAQVKSLLAELCGHPPRPWSKRKGVFTFSLKRLDALAQRYPGAPSGPKRPGAREQRLLDLLQAEVRAAGYYLVVASIGYKPTYLRLFPTSEKYAVLAASGTNGANYGLSPRDVIAWLLELEKDDPFVLTGCAFDSLAGSFVGPVVRADHWARRMFEFCPDLEGAPTALARELERTRSFGFWWD